MTQIIFFSFASLLIVSSLLVVLSSTPVKSVLSLILCFLNAAALLLITGAEFISAILVVVYIGAIVVLFLFVVMTLTSKELSCRKVIKLSYLPFLVLACAVIYSKITEFDGRFSYYEVINQDLKNTHAIGEVLYTKYFLHFQLAGLVLLIGMIGAIILSQMRKDPAVKRQNVWKQLTANHRTRITVVNNK